MSTVANFAAHSIDTVFCRLVSLPRSSPVGYLQIDDDASKRSADRHSERDGKASLVTITQTALLITTAALKMHNTREAQKNQLIAHALKIGLLVIFTAGLLLFCQKLTDRPFFVVFEPLY